MLHKLHNANAETIKPYGLKAIMLLAELIHHRDDWRHNRISTTEYEIITKELLQIGLNTVLYPLVNIYERSN